MATEFDLIAWVRAQARQSPAVRVGIGDDCASLDWPDDDCLITTDSVVAGVHFDPDSTSPEEIGRKAVARSLSDIAAMAALPAAAVAAVVLPRQWTMEQARRLYNGMENLAREFDCPIVGGDLSSAPAYRTGKPAPLTACVTVIGSMKGAKPALRSGARPGDRLFVTGNLGGSLLGRHLSFTPRIREARRLAELAPLRAMIDLSDGLAGDLLHICEESRHGAVIRAERIPIADAAREMARRTGRDPLHHALSDGEDYELLFAVAREDAEKLPPTLGELPLTEIGEIIVETDMYIADASGKRQRLDPAGWRHGIGANDAK